MEPGATRPGHRRARRSSADSCVPRSSPMRGSPGSRRHGLQPGWFDLLAALRRAGAPFELSPTELMGATMLTSGGVTKRLDRLVEAGLVERRPDPDDRRGTRVSLTRRGRTAIDRAIAAHVANEERPLDGLAAETGASSMSAAEAPRLARDALDCAAVPLPLLPTTVGRQLSAAGLADRPGAPRRPACRRACGRASSGGSRPSSSSRRRTTRPGSRSPTWSAPASTSSPTASSAARATRTGSRPRSTGSTSTTRAPRSTGPAIRTRCRESSGRSSRRDPVEVRDVEFLRANTDRRIKITLPGPFTMAQQAQDDFYGDPAELAMAYAAAVNAEARDLIAAGADVIQIDEPYLQARPDAAREYALPRSTARSKGSRRDTALHTCFGYAHIVHTRLAAATRSWPSSNDCDVGADLDRGRPAEPRLARPARACRQEDHPRRPRPRRPGSRDAGGRRRRGSARALEHVPAERLSSRPTAG